MEGEQKTSALVFATPLAALVIGAVIGFIIGAGQGRGEVAKLQAQIDAAKKFFPSVTDMRSVSGTVKSISGNTFVIESSLISVNPFEDLPKERTVTITGTTRIVFFEQKDRAVQQKEMEDFEKNMNMSRGVGSVITPPSPPTPFNEKIANAGDIKAGMTISVEASENMKEKSAFSASKIILTGMGSQLVAPGASSEAPIKIQ